VREIGKEGVNTPEKRFKRAGGRERAHEDAEETSLFECRIMEKIDRK